MKVTADKRASMSQTWSPTKHAEADMHPFWIKGEHGYDQVPMEMVSIYLGMPIGFNRYENSKHGQKVLANMLEDARIIGRSKLRITQKMHALKMFVFPRIDCRMMCADLARSNLDRWDTNIRGIVGEGAISDVLARRWFFISLSSRSSEHSCHSNDFGNDVIS
jgi:hypothetical protein